MRIFVRVLSPSLPIGWPFRRQGKGKKRLLFGAVDIGWRIELYSKWIEQHLGDQVEVESFVKHKVSYTQYPTSYTYELQYSDHPSPVQWTHALLFFLLALWRFDIFHFLSGETILTRKAGRIELRLYRLFGKRVVMHFVGTDIRNPEYVVWKDRHLRGIADVADEPPRSAPWQERLVKDSIDFAHHILVSTPDLLTIVPSARFLPVVLDLEKFDAECADSVAALTLPEAAGDVTILHAPSNVAMKGTALLEPAAKALRAEDAGVNVILTPELELETGSRYSVSRPMLFALYDQADIVVDQLTIGWYGLQSVEALMRGCAVICGIDEGLRDLLPDGCPILVTDADELPATLRQAVDQVRSGGVDTASQASWVRENHTMDRYGPVLSSLWLDDSG